MRWLHLGTSRRARDQTEFTDSQMAENYNYRAIWHDSGMSQHRLEQLAAYGMQPPWQRDGGENKLKELQSTKVKLPPTGTLEAAHRLDSLFARRRMSRLRRCGMI